MLIGYARVSTEDQNLSLQIDALKKAGCEKIFEEKSSGSKSNRPEFLRALEMLRAEDSLVVWKLDRLGRSMSHLVNLATDLATKNINLISLTDSINTGTPSGRFFFNIMASLAQMERELIKERTMAGLAAAKKAGRVGGRPSVMSESKLKSAKKLLDAGIPVRDVAHNLGISVPTLYRWIPASTKEELESAIPS